MVHPPPSRRPGPGDDPACPETASYGDLTCPRPSAPRNQCLLATELVLDSGACTKWSTAVPVADVGRIVLQRELTAEAFAG
jgi:hypothetical protein